MNLKVELLLLSQFGFTDKTLYQMYEQENEILEIIYNKHHPFYNKYFDVYTEKERELSKDFKVFMNWVDEFKSIMKKYKKNGVKIFFRFDNDFPLYIFDNEKVPLFLYCYGNLKLLDKDKKKVSIIGTRKPSKLSINKARAYTKKYVNDGYVIVSGMALGIDTIAHDETLNSNGETIAVLPSSFEKIYPKENEGLFNEIVNREGLIITTIGPFENSYKSSFLDRNSLVANLCTEMFLVEADLKSGSLNTVRKASFKGKRILYDSALIDEEVKEYLSSLGAIDTLEKS